MRKLSLLIPVLLFLPLAAQAQGTQIFGGYSYVRLDTAPSKTNFNGWNVSLTEKFFKVLGATADFGSTYASPNGVKATQTTYLFGPELSLPARVSPFVHALFGGARYSAAGTSVDSFATAVGAGIDVHAGPLLGFRLIEADYLTTDFSGTRQNDLRMSAGILLRF